MSTFWASLRPTTAPASPETTDSTNSPRWVRDSGGRSQSSPATTAARAPAPTTATSTRPQVSRTPADDAMTSRPPSSSPGGPPKSAPQAGQRLDGQGHHEHDQSQSGRGAPRQTTRTTPRRHPAHDDQHGEAVEREARVAQPVEPSADDRVLPEDRAELQTRPRENVPAEHQQRHDGDEPQRPEGHRPLRQPGHQGQQRGHDHHSREEHHERRPHPPPGHQVGDEGRHGHDGHRHPGEPQPRRHRGGYRTRRRAPRTAMPPPQHRHDERPQRVGHGQPQADLRAHGPKRRRTRLETHPVGQLGRCRAGGRRHRERAPGDLGVGRPDPGQRGRRQVLQLHQSRLPRRGGREQPTAVGRPTRHHGPGADRRHAVSDAGDDHVGAGIRGPHLRDQCVEPRESGRPLGPRLRQRPTVDEDDRAAERTRQGDAVGRHDPTGLGTTDRRPRPDRLHTGAGCRDTLGERARVGVVGAGGRGGEVLVPARHTVGDDRQRLAARAGHVRGPTTGRHGEPAVDRARPAAQGPHGHRPDGTLRGHGPHGRQLTTVDVRPRQPGRTHDDQARRLRGIRRARTGQGRPGEQCPEQGEHDCRRRRAAPHPCTSSCRAMTTRAAVHASGATAAGRPS